MKSTMEKYAGRIEKNEVDPVIQYNGLTSGLLLDPLQEGTPLEILGFGILRLDFGTGLYGNREKRSGLCASGRGL